MGIEREAGAISFVFSFFFVAFSTCLLHILLKNDDKSLLALWMPQTLIRSKNFYFVRIGAHVSQELEIKQSELATLLPRLSLPPKSNILFAFSSVLIVLRNSIPPIMILCNEAVGLKGNFFSLLSLKQSLSGISLAIHVQQDED